MHDYLVGHTVFFFIACLSAIQIGYLQVIHMMHVYTYKVYAVCSYLWCIVYMLICIHGDVIR
jgi:hypothetical protein